LEASQIKTLRVSTRDFSYEKIKEKIMNLELEPGTKISEKELADELNVSRTPVREAFMKLAQEELLDIVPQSGTTVSRINLNYVEEGRFIRERIEKEIVALACHELSDDYLFQLESNIAMQQLILGKHNQNHIKLFDLDEEFHRILFQGCGKIRTWKMLEQLNSHFNRLRVLRLSSDLDWNNIISQHKEIYELITRKEEEKVKEKMEEHLKLVVIEKNLLNDRYPHYFI
jgi:GntR family transcriptional regulator, rspAB operon transcriptional repressor